MTDPLDDKKKLKVAELVCWAPAVEMEICD